MSDMSIARPQEKPKKPHSGSERRKRYVLNTFRSTPEERAEMQANAGEVGLSFGSFIRSLAVANPQTRPVRRPRPDLKLFAQAMGRLGIYASNAHQLLKLARRGEMVYADELAEASKKLDELADELLKIVRGQM